ncbi:MAG: DUF2167 domain-containing protein [Planctomycetales bacterium]|nr:DUF2167 domain-containing protein [Planctomycetales bacterium]
MSRRFSAQVEFCLAASLWALALLTLGGAWASVSRAQEAATVAEATDEGDLGDLGDTEGVADPSVEESAPMSAEEADKFITEQLELQWVTGPNKAEIGDQAEITLPEGYRYLDQSGTHKLLRLFDNIPGDEDLGLLSPVGTTDWFVVFSFEDIGYVKDDEKDSIDKDALLEHFQQATEAHNEQRLAAGISAMHLAGWAVEPFFNDQTKSLEWGLKYETDGTIVVNYFTKRLGRRGVMNCNLVVSPEDLEEVMPLFRQTMGGFEFSAGQTYAEWREGDKIAEYGLTALVAGGALAMAAKSGLLGKLWKVIVFGILAVGGLLKKALQSLTGRSESAR